MATYYMRTSDQQNVDVEGRQRKASKKSVAPEVQDAIRKIRFVSPSDSKTWKLVCRQVIFVAISVEEDVFDAQGIMSSNPASGTLSNSLWDSRQWSLRKILTDAKLNPIMRLLDAHLQLTLQHILDPGNRVPSDEDSDASAEGGFTEKLESYSTYKFELSISTILSALFSFKEVLQSVELDVVLRLLLLTILASTPTDAIPFPRPSLFSIVLRLSTSLFGPYAVEAFGTLNVIHRYLLNYPLLYMLIDFLGKILPLLFSDSSDSETANLPFATYEFLRVHFFELCELLSTLMNSEDFAIHGVPYFETHRSDGDHFRSQLHGKLKTVPDLDTTPLLPLLSNIQPLDVSTRTLHTLLMSRLLGEGRLLHSLKGENKFLPQPCAYVASPILRMPLIRSNFPDSNSIFALVNSPSTSLHALNSGGALASTLNSVSKSQSSVKVHTPNTPQVLYTRSSDWTVATPDRIPLLSNKVMTLPKSTDEYLELRRRMRVLLDFCIRLSIVE